MVGGVSGFIGAYIVGARHGKEKDPTKKRDILNNKKFNQHKALVDNPEEFERWIIAREKQPFTPFSFPFIVIGTFILWVSWLFFNGGSTLNMFQMRRQGVAKIIMNTIIAGAAAGIVATATKPHVMNTYTEHNRYDVGALCNGILGGLVAITAGCFNVQPWAAFVIGVIGGAVYVYGCKFLQVVGVDDPVEATAVHGCCGIWGLIAVGFFDNDKGIFCGTTKSGAFFGWQWIGMICILAWALVLSGGYFWAMRSMGMLRVSLLDEIIGLDITEMGGEDPIVLNAFRDYDKNKKKLANKKVDPDTT
jgi:ammonium transporter, Amt family